MPAYSVVTPLRSYPAVVERGVLRRASEFLPARHGKVFVITERRVWEFLQPEVAFGDHELLFFPGGEQRKRLAEAEALAAQMAQRGADRSSVVIALGGGIVTDVAGFVAATFMRGVELIQAPTTLLAQVDAAVGGKTGVNLEAGKNLVGCFYQPLCVLIDPGVLNTLPEREYRAGLFEVIKHGIIADPELFTLLSQCPTTVKARAEPAVERMISDSVRIKAEVVSEDEKESDRRRILNFGHTFGHALEAETGYTRFLHGEAVGWGMQVATRLAGREGLLAPEAEGAILQCIEAYGPLPSLEGIEAGKIANRLRGDKKTIQGQMFLVLPEKIGRVRVVSGIENEPILRAIQDSLPA